MLIGLVLAWSAACAQGEPAAEPVDFQREIRPLLSDRCFTCHGPDAAAREAELRLDLRAGAVAEREGIAAIVPGDREESELWYRITTTHAADRMPPEDSALSLSPEEIDLLGRWIDQGAEYQTHWAFVAPQAHQPPAVDSDWPRDPLDHFVLARLHAAGLQPADEASDADWLRRVCLVLTGLPPTAEQVAAFPERLSRAALVDELLASPACGEHLAASWMDIARYADTYGYQNDRERRVWPYRDWVIAAYNQNLPYDDFVRWQIAGDLLDEPSREQLVATAFQRLHRQTNEGGSVEEEFRVEYVSDRVHTTGTAFLGLTFECARCHDHKYDPLTQREYYQFSDYFDDLDESGLYSHFTNATPTPALGLPSDEQSLALADAEAAVQRAEQELAAAERAAAEDAEGGAEAVPLSAATHFALEDWEGNATPARGSAEAMARAEGGFEPTDGASGRGVRLNGDEGLRFAGVGAWRRADPFACGFALRIDGPVERAVLLHRSRAWHDAASQGWQLLLEDGRLTAALVHFWPGDMAAVRTLEPLPLGQWLELELRYDGSSRAAGLELWADGRRLPVEIVQDSLTRSITGGGPGDPAFGARFRDRGFSQGAVDEVWFRDGWPTPAANPAVAAARAALRAARQTRDERRDAIPQLMVMSESAQPRAARLLQRGAYDQPGPAVGRGVPAVLAAGPAPRDRRELADWLLDPAHPLTARVEVDRLWRTVFGRGLVRTPENWGSQGEAPTHPALLDTLAREFTASGWNRRVLLRRLVLSATFAQAAQPTSPRSLEVDPENRLWSCVAPRRMSAEMVRDSMLAHAGLLVRRVGGPSVKPYQPPGLWQEKSGLVYQPSTGEGLYRRSLYTFWKRTSPPPAMMVFDAAKRDVCVVRRQETRTPLQVLVNWNDPQRLEAARVLASRLLATGEPEASPEARLDALGRQLGFGAAHPLGRLAPLFREELAAFRADPEAASALLAVGEAPLESQADPAVLAAWTVVCATVFSSDLYQFLR